MQREFLKVLKAKLNVEIHSPFKGTSSWEKSTIPFVLNQIKTTISYNDGLPFPLYI